MLKELSKKVFDFCKIKIPNCICIRHTLGASGFSCAVSACGLCSLLADAAPDATEKKPLLPRVHPTE